MGLSIEEGGKGFFEMEGLSAGRDMAKCLPPRPGV